ncbi:MAG: PDZ domain-containing protein [Gemmatimonadota bacterium]|nr:MAG: PDZ domain-containing protein [Gemmatimonadota bacterium]
MRCRRLIGRVVLAVALMMTSAVGVLGQEDVPVQAAKACPAGQVLRGDMGISGFKCNCAYYEDRDGVTYWHFRSEPEVISIGSGSPAEGKVREGDVIAAIDGMLITTVEAGRRFANLRAGEKVVLTIRRGADTWSKLELVAQERCEPLPEPAPAPAPVAAAAPAADTVAAPPKAVAIAGARPGVVDRPTAAAHPVPAPAGVADRPAIAAAVPAPPAGVLPSGSFGFGIRCNCVVHDAAVGSPPVWVFREPPEVYSVESDSPAELAGLKRGDRLIEIDGISLVSGEGGRKFGAVQAGQQVEFTYRRGGETRQVSMTAEERHVPSAIRALPPDLLRYAGEVGDVEIEVRGTSAVIVSEIEPGREIEILTKDARIRIKRSQ